MLRYTNLICLCPPNNVNNEYFDYLWIKYNEAGVEINVIVNAF